MKPTQFRYSNRILQPSGKRYSPNVTSVAPLAVWTDGEQCVLCWKMSLPERLSALLFGRVWLALLSGETQPPACVVASKEYLQEGGSHGRCKRDGEIGGSA